VFVDHGESGRIRDRPEWLACLDYLRPGDTLIVPVLDRHAGTTTMAIETINDLHERGVNVLNDIVRAAVASLPGVDHAGVTIIQRSRE
jgi:hypothetical protein